MWRTLKSWLGWGGGGTPTQLFSGGRLVTSPGGLASTMNRFFVDKVRNLRRSVPVVQTDPLAKMKEAMQGNRCKLELKTVSIEDVSKVIKNLKNSSATGVDYIDTRTVKLASDLLAPALTHISLTFPLQLIPSQAYGNSPKSSHFLNLFLLILYSPKAIDQWHYSQFLQRY